MDRYPKLTIGHEVRPRLRNDFYDKEHYASYLATRGLPTEEIGKITIGIFNSGHPLPELAMPVPTLKSEQAHILYIPRNYELDDSRHKIAIHLPLEREAMVSGAVLRSASELILATSENPEWADEALSVDFSNDTRFCAGLAGMMAVGLVVNNMYGASEARLYPHQIVVDAAVFFAATKLMLTGVRAMGVNPHYDQAKHTMLQRAQQAIRKHKNQLPNGVLNIQVSAAPQHNAYGQAA